MHPVNYSIPEERNLVMALDDCEIQIVANLDEISCRAAEEFIYRAREAIQAKGFFTGVLSGGSTPRALYTLLASSRYLDQVPWPKIHVFWGDERCVPPTHPESNFRMASDSLLSKVPIPKENIHRMPAEQENHDRAAQEYENTLKTFFRLKTGGYPRFDLVLLGMGDDGHTASLFPGAAALRETKRLAVANYIEKLHTYRLTLTAMAINYARNILFLISGEPKASVLKEVLEGAYEPNRLPTQLIQPVGGRVTFLVDRPAASKLAKGNPQTL